MRRKKIVSKRKYTRRAPTSETAETAETESVAVAHISSQEVHDVLTQVSKIQAQNTLTADRRRFIAIALQSIMSNPVALQWTSSVIADRAISIGNEIVTRLQTIENPIQIPVTSNGHPDELLRTHGGVEVAVSTAVPSVEA